MFWICFFYPIPDFIACKSGLVISLMTRIATENCLGFTLKNLAVKQLYGTCLDVCLVKYDKKLCFLQRSRLKISCIWWVTTFLFLFNCFIFWTEVEICWTNKISSTSLCIHFHNQTKILFTKVSAKRERFVHICQCNKYFTPRGN